MLLLQYYVYVRNMKTLIIFYNIMYICGPGNVVGIATAYGLDGLGIESRWGEIFRTSPDRP
jgi:hypothetical protein